MTKDPLVYIDHILNCIQKIKTYTTDFDEAKFLQDNLTQDAVIRNFEIIGEATKQLSPDFKEKYNKIEWKKIAGMRDKLIHDYIGVDLWAVWGVVEEIIPTFEQQILNIIKVEKNLK